MPSSFTSPLTKTSPHCSVLQYTAATQNQALSALLFLYREVLEIDPGPVCAVRARRPKRLPATLTREEARRVIAELSGTNQLIARLIYGSGLCLIECLRLRVADLDFAHLKITVRDRQGVIDHATVLPESLVAPLQEHLRRVKMIHQRDLEAGYGAVFLPAALEGKDPRIWSWQYVFPAQHLSTDPRSGVRRRHHLGESGPEKAVRKAAQSIGIPKRVSCQIFRHCFATHLIEAGYDVRTVQELMGHKDVKTTMTYSHILNLGGPPIRSPLDVHHLPQEREDEQTAQETARPGT